MAQKWEYHIEAVNATAGVPQIQTRLSQLGESSWEAVTNVVGQQAGQVFILFKRPK